VNKKRRFKAKRRRRLQLRHERLRQIMGARTLTWAERNEYEALYGNRGY
jgi:hypothetical protein